MHNDFDKPYGHRPPMPPYEAPKLPHPKPRNHEARFYPFLFHPKIPQHFNFWCNKIIPLAYDDSLSYYEVLARTTDYLNNMLNDEKMLAMNIEEISHCFVELQNFVNDYFAYYQSKGIIVFDFAIANDNYKKYLPDLDTAQINTIYRLKFTEDTEQNVPDNIPVGALPLSGDECILMTVSNFCLRRAGNKWEEIPPAVEDYSTLNNYQLLITDKDIYYRENNGDIWNEWKSIFGSFWASKIDEIQSMIDASLDDIWEALRQEIARATAREDEIEGNLNSEIARSTAKDTELEQAIEDESDARQSADDNLQRQITNEVRRAQEQETTLSTAITSENSRAVTRENELSTAITYETSRAESAEVALSGRIAAWETNLANEILTRTTADETLQDNIDTVADDLADEVTRAEGEEARIEGLITTEVSNREADTADIRANFIPNEGNILNSSLTLSRLSLNISSKVNDSEKGMLAINPAGVRLQGTDVHTVVQGMGVTIYSPNGDIANNLSNGNFSVTATKGNANTGNINFTANNGSMNIVLGENENETISGRKDVTTALGMRFTDTDSDTTDGNRGIQLNAYLIGLATSGNTGLLQVESARVLANTSNTTINATNDLTLSSNRNLQIAKNDTSDARNTTQIDFANQNIALISGLDANSKAYYYKFGERATSGKEIVVKDDLSGFATSASLSGYIPNIGNNIADDFTLTRDDITLESNNGTIIIDSTADLETYIRMDNTSIDIIADEVLKVGGNDGDNYMLFDGNGNVTLCAQSYQDLLIHNDTTNNPPHNYFKLTTESADYVAEIGSSETIKFIAPDLVNNVDTVSNKNACNIYVPNNVVKWGKTTSGGVDSYLSSITFGEIDGDLNINCDNSVNIIGRGGSVFRDLSGIEIDASTDNMTLKANDIDILANDTDIYLKAEERIECAMRYGFTCTMHGISNVFGIPTYYAENAYGENLYDLYDSLDGRAAGTFEWYISNNYTLSDTLECADNLTVKSTRTNNTIRIGTASDYFYVSNKNVTLTEINTTDDTKTIFATVSSGSHITLKNCRITCANLFDTTYTGHLIIDGCIIDNVNAINLQTLGNIVIKDSIIKGAINIIGSLTDRIIMSNVKYGSLTGASTVVQQINCSQI